MEISKVEKSVVPRGSLRAEFPQTHSGTKAVQDHPHTDILKVSKEAFDFLGTCQLSLPSGARSELGTFCEALGDGDPGFCYREPIIGKESESGAT